MSMPKVLDINGTQMVDGRDLHKSLKMKRDFSTWVKSNISKLQLESQIDYLIEKPVCKTGSGGHNKVDYLFSLDSSIQIAMTVKNNPISASVLSDLMTYKDKVIIVRNLERQEVMFENMLRKSLKDIICFETQYRVDNYRIDFYIADLNLAIEYDEEQHKYCIDNDVVRQKYIEDKIGCTFIRVNEGEEFEGVNEIIKFVMKNKNQVA